MIALAHSLPKDAFEVDRLVAQLGDLRQLSQRRRHRGKTPSLPSRKSVIAAFDDLVAALYPRHFGPQALNAEDLDAFVAKTLRWALRALQGQIRIELALDAEAAFAPGREAEIAEVFAEALPDVRALADSDARAGFEGDPSAASVDEAIFSFPGFAAVLWHRLAHLLYKLGARSWRASPRRTRTAAPASTSIPARRSANASSSTTAQGS